MSTSTRCPSMAKELSKLVKGGRVVVGRLPTRSLATAAYTYSHPSEPLASSSTSASQPRRAPPSSSTSTHARQRSSHPLPIPNSSAPSPSTFLTTLLRSPKPFPPALAERILTHKSYRGAQLLGFGYASRTGGSAGVGMGRAEQGQEQGQANPVTTSHNARLSFLGKRAFLTYLMLFLHHHTSTTLASTSNPSIPGKELAAIPALLKGGTEGKILTLEEKLENLGNLSNLGRTVGRRWGLDGEGVMRWQSNLTEDLAEERDAGALKVYGTGVQAILGGTMMQFGSPAAQRLFHLHLLPHLAPQLRDQGLIQAVDEMRERMLREGGGSCVVA